MARGSLSKENITKALLQIFPGAFIDADGKTVRIPTNCEGELIEVKVALTAAKDIAGNASVEASSKQPSPQNIEMTAEEIQQVKDLIKELGL